MATIKIVHKDEAVINTKHICNVAEVSIFRVRFDKAKDVPGHTAWRLDGRCLPNTDLGIVVYGEHELEPYYTALLVTGINGRSKYHIVDPNTFDAYLMEQGKNVERIA